MNLSEKIESVIGDERLLDMHYTLSGRELKEWIADARKLEHDNKIQFKVIALLVKESENKG